MTNGEKTWKFTLNNTPNGVKFYEELASQKAMEINFQVVKSGNEKFFYSSGTAFGFEPASTNPDSNSLKKYKISVDSTSANEFIYIWVEYVEAQYGGNEIGEIIEGIDELSELDSYFDQIYAEGAKVTFIFNLEESEGSGGSVVYVVIIVTSVVYMLIINLALLLCC